MGAEVGEGGEVGEEDTGEGEGLGAGAPEAAADASGTDASGTDGNGTVGTGGTGTDGAGAGLIGVGTGSGRAGCAPSVAGMTSPCPRPGAPAEAVQTGSAWAFSSLRWMGGGMGSSEAG
ncbi:hypothetical protein K378_00559 [Streptomyces sp. Amel2xB2]|uniref:hypothetical protein n=1 Tax=Streptomyces sp. Amel2xB2 TaxID=1305829 RepID=UPI000DB96A32|nr:hypothetical protein [Streptomyces sp. Amel2xB2]RAJ71739.1 hypothetical protein K378_00559 [Streptomyces sp. Amel2xB2]